MSARQDEVLAQQIAYYRARANEYDEWFLRQGRYDRGAELNQQWFDEADAVARALDAFHPAGRVLELAAGTGLWTQRLVSYASELTALDASPEVLALNAARVQSERVRYERADLFAWQPSERYDVVFFSFWLSHVPPARFADFWWMVRSCLAPGGRVFLIDSLYTPESTARDHQLGAENATTLTRRLNDGREFPIVKVFYRPAELTAKLALLGWQAELQATAHYFLYGSCVPHA